MIALHPQFIVDEHEEKKAVVLPFAEWIEILHEIEDLEEIKAYDAAKADTKDKVIPFDQVINQISSGEVK